MPGQLSDGPAAEPGARGRLGAKGSGAVGTWSLPLPPAPGSALPLLEAACGTLARAVSPTPRRGLVSTF